MEQNQQTQQETPAPTQTNQPSQPNQTTIDLEKQIEALKQELLEKDKLVKLKEDASAQQVQQLASKLDAIEREKINNSLIEEVGLNNELIEKLDAYFPTWKSDPVEKTRQNMEQVRKDFNFLYSKNVKKPNAGFKTPLVVTTGSGKSVSVEQGEAKNWGELLGGITRAKNLKARENNQHFQRKMAKSGYKLDK